MTPKNKRGLETWQAMVIAIALVIAVMGFCWQVVDWTVVPRFNQLEERADSIPSALKAIDDKPLYEIMRKAGYERTCLNWVNETGNNTMWGFTNIKEIMCPAYCSGIAHTKLYIEHDCECIVKGEPNSTKGVYTKPKCTLWVWAKTE